MSASNSFGGRARQAWTIARIELRRAYFAKHSLWVYVLALLPSAIFFGSTSAMFRARCRAGTEGSVTMKTRSHPATT